MQLQYIYKSDINRDINGVIKVAQNDEKSIEQELREYIITRELRKHFNTFFNNYEKSHIKQHKNKSFSHHFD